MAGTKWWYFLLFITAALLIIGPVPAATMSAHVEQFNDLPRGFVRPGEYLLFIVDMSPWAWIEPQEEWIVWEVVLESDNLIVTNSDPNCLDQGWDCEDPDTDEIYFLTQVADDVQIGTRLYATISGDVFEGLKPQQAFSRNFEFTVVNDVPEFPPFVSLVIITGFLGILLYIRRMEVR